MSIYDLSGEQLLTLSWLIATKSVQGLSLAEQDVLGYFFTSVGENILLIRAQNELLTDVRNERGINTEGRSEGFWRKVKKIIDII